jgi:ADP-ribose pyrophosphatase
MRAWNVEHSETLFEHKIFRLLRQDLRAAEGESSTRQALVLDAPDWVNVIPRLDDGRILLVRQWRYGIGAPTLEIPGGMIDAGESASAAAARELVEETGYRAEGLVELGSVDANPAFLTNRCTTFLASGLREEGPPLGDGEEEVEVVKVPLQEIPRLIASGEIRHAIVIAAFHWLLLRSMPTG